MKIGIIDSGMGGYFFMKNIAIRYPKCQFMLIKDVDFFPYGNKSNEVLQERFNHLLNKMYKKNISKVIVACNTLSSKVRLPSNASGVIKPVLMEIDKQKYHYVTVIATVNTIESNVYQDHFNELGIKYQMIACTNLIENIEYKKDFNESLNKILESIDASSQCLVLGCTHLIGIKNIIRNRCYKDIISVDEIYEIEE